MYFVNCVFFLIVKTNITMRQEKSKQIKYDKNTCFSRLTGYAIQVNKINTQTNTIIISVVALYTQTNYIIIWTKKLIIFNLYTSIGLFYFVLKRLFVGMAHCKKFKQCERFNVTKKKHMITFKPN